jgi:ketosteroid isomerase-like protein
MDDVECVVNFFELIEANDWFALNELISEDFKYFGFTKDPIDKKTWLEFQVAVQKAFPDWAYNIQKVEQINKAVEVTVHISGTHTGDLVLPLAGLAPIPATHRKISMPIEHALIKVDHGKIKELRIEQQFHGSLPGLLAQLGLE